MRPSGIQLSRLCFCAALFYVLRINLNDYSETTLLNIIYNIQEGIVKESP